MEENQPTSAILKHWTGPNFDAFLFDYGLFQLVIDEKVINMSMSDLTRLADVLNHAVNFNRAEIPPVAI